MRFLLHYFLPGTVGGIAFGLIASLTFSYLVGTGKYYPSTPLFMDQFSTELGAMTVSVLVWAAIGLCSALSQKIFDLIEGSLLKATLIHFAIIYPTVLVFGYVAGWFQEWQSILSMTISFVIIYGIVWALSYMYYRNEVAKVNQRMQMK